MSLKTIQIGNEVFDLHFDFFVCPTHGIFIPGRIDPDWTTDEGCPIFTNDWGERCDEPLTAVYLDTLFTQPDPQPDQCGGSGEGRDA